MATADEIPIPIQATIDAVTRVEVADRQHGEAEPITERVAGPGAEDRGNDDDRKPAAGIAADEDVQSGVEGADEHRKDDRRPDAHRPVATS